MQLTSTRAACDEIARRDPVMAELVERHGYARLRRKPRRDERFASLARSVTYQQLAGAAARSIWGRLQIVVGQITPQAILMAGEEGLRSTGLSRAKAACLLDLATRVESGERRLHSLGYLSDETVIDELTVVMGIGRSTAQMFLMFTLRRPDVWPAGDLGVRSGYARAWGLHAPPAEDELHGLGERFRPYRSFAAWYCWRAVETVTPE